jgi:hypothetical protein
MIKELKSYIQVLKDRVKIFRDYENICSKAGDSRGVLAYSTGACDISDIIAELEGLVKREEESHVEHRGQHGRECLECTFGSGY